MVMMRVRAWGRVGEGVGRGRRERERAIQRSSVLAVCLRSLLHHMHSFATALCRYVEQTGDHLEVDVVMASQSALVLPLGTVVSPGSEAVLQFGSGTLRYAPYTYSVASDDSVSWSAATGAGAPLSPTVTAVDSTTSVLTMRLPRGAVVSAQFTIDFTQVTCSRDPCAKGTFESAGCTPFDDRVCAACSTARCPASTFQNSACSADSDRTCSDCTTECSEGFFASAPCSSTSDMVCSACSVCGPGAVQAGECSTESDVMCQCPSGTYGDPYSSLGCLSCDESCSECTTFGPGGCTPGACADTYFFQYGKDGGCVPCTTCATGMYVAAACGVDTDSQCGVCSSACSTVEGCTGPSDADCVSCAPGYFTDGNGACVLVCEDVENCTPCATGEFFDVPTMSCQTCTECASQGMFTQQSCSPLSDTLCGLCDSTCATCTDDAAGSCLTCPDGYQYSAAPPSSSGSTSGSGSSSTVVVDGSTGSTSMISGASVTTGYCVPCASCGTNAHPEDAAVCATPETLQCVCDDGYYGNASPDGTGCSADCVLSDYGEWEECVMPCSSEPMQYRRRGVVFAGGPDGVQCSLSDLVEGRPCEAPLCGA